MNVLWEVAVMRPGRYLTDNPKMQSVMPIRKCNYEMQYQYIFMEGCCYDGVALWQISIIDSSNYDVIFMLSFSCCHFRYWHF